MKRVKPLRSAKQKVRSTERCTEVCSSRLANSFGCWVPLPWRASAASRAGVVSGDIPPSNHAEMSARASDCRIFRMILCQLDSSVANSVA